LHKRLYNDLDYYGETKRTRAFSEPQSASCTRTAIKSKSETPAVAARLRRGYDGQAD